MWSVSLAIAVSHGALDIVHTVLGPLIDGVLALAAACLEVREPLLESQAEDSNIDIVAQLLSCDKEVMTEDEGSK